MRFLKEGGNTPLGTPPFHTHTVAYLCVYSKCEYTYVPVCIHVPLDHVFGEKETSFSCEDVCACELCPWGSSVKYVLGFFPCLCPETVVCWGFCLLFQ